ncbi:peptidase S8/S53 domain-containing protein [Mucor lusitanicus]|uniref:Peptidase S8/S53 domain-containing protein n=1 Tax=Mucor circinelloides f. lusitanicus TaxID=29924 RepID=A0A8H4BNA6_MUCCL|nr:peptidase S8/S53 domain-containing protein [Mucor lusitanicus]
MSSLQNRSTTRIANKLSRIQNNRTSIPEIYSIGNFHWYVDSMDDADAQTLAQSEHVSHLHKDDPIFYMTELVQTDVPSWGLDRIDQRKGEDDKFHFPSSAGEGVDVYLIDTGVNIDHIDFGGRAVHGPAFTSGRNQDPTDYNGHGSFVAGICCGKVHGVAKKANIISLKALDQGGSGRLSNILLALHWAVKRHVANPGANLSLAADFHLPTNQAIEQAIELGIHFSIAAGNQGKEACRYSPASAKNALVVGAIDQDDSIAPYSNFGSCVSIYAPGTAITSVWHNHRTAVHTLSGTSMAAPHVTGVMAILLSQQDYTPAELIDKVRESATLAISSRTESNDIVDEISRLTGVEYKDSSIIKVLYMDSSLDNFIRTDIVASSMTNRRYHLMPFGFYAVSSMIYLSLYGYLLSS